MANTIRLDGCSLTRKQLVAIARQGIGVELDARALQRVQSTADFLSKQLDQGEPIYGVTTGFGSNADRLLSGSRARAQSSGAQTTMSLVEELQYKLIVSHAVCVGDPLPRDVVRAMLAIRINTLMRGHSGIRVQTLQTLAALLNRDIVPVIPEKGSVGASGDLAPLSHMALLLLGDGEAFVAGERVSGAEALKRAGLDAVHLSCKEGLALNNGTAQMLASAVLALEDFERLNKTADIAAALSMEAFCARSAALDARVHALRPHPGQVATAGNLRALLQGSNLVDIAYHRVPRFHPWSAQAWGAGAERDRTFDLRWQYAPLPAGSPLGKAPPFRGGKKQQPQDAYCMRCAPQVHGAAKDAWAQAGRIIDIELNAVTDNPIVFPDTEGGDAGQVISAGNFHGMPLALAMSYLKAAIPVLASISERRLNKLVDAATSDGLPPFLVGNEDGTDSGFMIVQYTAAALVNDLATRAHPASVYSVPTSANAEDHVSMGTNEARHVLDMLGDLQHVLALELFTAAQALQVRMEILAAAQRLAREAGKDALLAKIVQVDARATGFEVDRPALEAAAADLATDLAQATDFAPGPASAAVLAAVRAAGLDYVRYDRSFAADVQRACALAADNALVDAVESLLGRELALGWRFPN